MTQNALFSEDESNDPQVVPGIGTQILALASAACVGAGLFFGSVLLGIALFAIVLAAMNIDTGSGWAGRLRAKAVDRECRVLRHVLTPQ